MVTQPVPMELELAAAAMLSGDPPKPRRHGAAGVAQKAAPAAFDEVFAALDRGLADTKGTIEPPVRSIASLDPKPFRSVANQLDRQRERLAQLLRDIECGASN